MTLLLYTPPSMNSADNAIAALREGNILGLIDDASAEESAFLIANARSISSEAVCQLVNLGAGVICAALSKSRLRELGLSSMVSSARVSGAPQMSVSVEARQGVTTGISASDRARTLRMLAQTSDPRKDLVTPGHIFPIAAHDGGVLVRSAAPEAAVDLLRIATGASCAAFSHVLGENGDCLSGSEAEKLFTKHSITYFRVSDVVSKRLETESILETIAEAKLPSKYSDSFRAVCLRSNLDGVEHLALVNGKVDQRNLSNPDPVAVRFQAEDRLSDLFAAGPATEKALVALGNPGVFVYIRHPTEGLLESRVKRLNSGKKAAPLARPQQLRELGLGAQILTSLGVRKVRILSRSKRDLSGVSAFNIEVVDQVSL